MRLASLLLLSAFGLALAGCAGGPWAIVPLVLSLVSLVAAAGCAESHGATSEDAGTRATEDGASDARADRDVGRDAAWDGGSGGHYEGCCTDIGADGHGRLSTCWCPASFSCNYGLGLLRCADGSCMYGSGTPLGGCPDDDAGTPDAGTIAPDAGGTWEPCCELGPDGIGVVSTCFCPASLECNYGWFDRCDDGSCVLPGGACPGDAGSPDAG